MATLYTQKDHNVRLTWFYLTVFLCFVIFVGWVFSQALGSSKFLYISVIFAVAMNFISYWWSDKIVLSMSGAKEVTRDNAKPIYNLVDNLCITAGLPVPKIYVIPDAAPNAFATGRDPEHAVVALTSGIIEKLEKPELEGVIAHELSHIGNRDILIGTVVVVLVGFISILSDWFIRLSFWSGGGDDNKSGGLFVLIGFLLSLLAPISATLIQLAISRKREFLADASGALLTRYPEGLARALEKISADKSQLRRVNSATAHMYISSPFKSGGKLFLSKLFMTHPPVEERIRMLREMDL